MFCWFVSQLVNHSVYSFSKLVYLVYQTSVVHLVRLMTRLVILTSKVCLGNQKIVVVGGGGQGGPILPPPVPCIPGSRPFFLDFLPFVLFRLRNIMQCCVISPYFSRLPPPPFPLPPPVPLPPPILPVSRVSSCLQQSGHQLSQIIRQLIKFGLINLVN